MAKCSKCGKSGLFLKLEDGLCKSCFAAPKQMAPKPPAFEPIIKPRATYAEIVPSDPSITERSFFYSGMSFNCVSEGDRVRIDRLRNSPVGYLPPEIADLAMRGQVQSVYFDSFVSPDTSTGDTALRIKLRIWLVPSGGKIPTPPPDPLDVERETKYIYPKVVDDCSIVYWYPSVPVANVNREKLRNLVSVKKSSLDAVDVSVELAPDGDIVLLHDGVMMGKVMDRQKMCADWLNKKLLLRCVFSCYKDGAETVALAFYRNDLLKYSSAKYVIVKLTSFRSEDAQFCISSMKGPEKLNIHSGSGRKILDIYGETIGNLPKKYQDLYDEDGIDAVYFDHFDTVEDDDMDEAIYVPYVKLYLSE